MSKDEALLNVKKSLVKRKKDLNRQITLTRERDLSASEIDCGSEFDQAASVENREMTFALSSRDRAEIKAINNALKRMENGTFGICADCGDEITLERIKILPFTPYCKDCQENREVT